MSDSSHRTAISRSRPSAPAKLLSDMGLLVGRKLDYGCGRGKDAEVFGMERFDPHYAPDMPDGLFNTITCIYVLNVIEDPEVRDHVLDAIRSKLAEGGRAYITVRNDLAALRGRTSTGTWQGHIVLDLPVVKKTSMFVTYLLNQGAQQ